MTRHCEGPRMCDPLLEHTVKSSWNHYHQVDIIIILLQQVLLGAYYSPRNTIKQTNKQTEFFMLIKVLGTLESLLTSIALCDSLQPSQWEHHGRGDLILPSWLKGAAEAQWSAEGLMPNRYYSQPPNFRTNNHEQWAVDPGNRCVLQTQTSQEASAYRIDGKWLSTFLSLTWPSNLGWPISRGLDQECTGLQSAMYSFSDKSLNSKMKNGSTYPKTQR